MNEPIIIAIVVGMALMGILTLAAMRVFGGSGQVRTRNIVDRIAKGSAPAIATDADNRSNARRDDDSIIYGIPGVRNWADQIRKAGFGLHIGKVATGVCLLMLALLAILLPTIGLLGLPIALLLGFMVPRVYFKRKIKKRNLQFLDMFPEAIDMIVRSVRSGHPLNAAMRMIADNMEPPVSTEFRQVMNEVAYGRPLVEALQRMAERIDEQDVHFFVVVLSVQQETGGNLAEILHNLSSVIRGRKKLSQKIRAMTSEGRATAWVLGLLPVVQFGAISVTSPDYLTPLYTTVPGNIVFATAIGLVLLAVWIVSQMINIDI